VLKGNKVELREVRRSDLQHFLKWFNDPEVTQYLGMYLPMTEMAEQKYIEDLPSRGATEARFVICAIDSGEEKPIGSMGLHSISPKDHSATFGIGIGEKDYWSRGYGSEAARLLIKYGFEQLNLHRISSSVWAFNERSYRMHLRVGFKEEGRLRDWVFINGRYHDRVNFGMLRQEWEKKAQKS